MTTFSATKKSEATVAHPRQLVWEVLTDPDTVARLTPMVRSITARGDQWRWQLARMSVLGQSFELAFTEAMTYDPMSTIIFRHAPQADERAGTDGRYELSDAGRDSAGRDGADRDSTGRDSAGRDSGGEGGVDRGSTHLRIALTVTADLPFPRLAKPAVQAAMHAVLTAMGSGFGRSLEKELKTREAGPR